MRDAQMRPTPPRGNTTTSHSTVCRVPMTRLGGAAESDDRQVLAAATEIEYVALYHCTYTKLPNRWRLKSGDCLLAVLQAQTR